jgi:LemA protein
VLTTSLIFWGIAALLLFWALGAYNRLVGVRAQLTQALNALAVHWQANAQSLRSELASLSHAPETDSAWASLGDEASNWRPLAQATKQLQACLAAVQAHPSAVAQLDDIASVRAAYQVMVGAWDRLSGTHDDLAGEAVPHSLTMLWQHQQLQAQEKLRDYNAAVHIYNHAVQQFPAILVSWIFGFSVAQAL